MNNLQWIKVLLGKSDDAKDKAMMDDLRTACQSDEKFNRITNNLMRLACDIDLEEYDRLRDSALLKRGSPDGKKGR